MDKNMISEKMNEIENEIKLMNHKIDLIDNKINNISQIMNEDIKPNCNKMNNHISFIEELFSKIKLPFYS